MTEEELVAELFACPRCGERRMEYLGNDGCEHVECETCGFRYTLPASDCLEDADAD